MNRRRPELLLLLFLVIGAVLRIARLDTLPPAIFRDEAEKAYTAYSILKTGRALTGPGLPLFINVFGVTTSAIYQYLAIPFIAVAGLNEWGARLPAACVALATVFLNWMVMRRQRGVMLAICATLFLVLSPWHIVFSRWAQQGIIVPLFLCGAMLGLQLFLSGKKWGLLLCAVGLAFALYTYEVCRAFVPLLGLGIVVLFWRDLMRQWKWSAASLAVFVLLTAPVIGMMTLQTGAAQARFRAISIIQPGRDWSEIALLFARNYASHFSPDFLVIRGDALLRHSAGIGQMTIMEVVCAVAGIAVIAKRRRRDEILWVWWILCAPVAASLTQEGVPHALRTIVALPAMQNVAATGLAVTIERLQPDRRAGAVKLAALLQIISFLPFAYLYFYTFTPRSAVAWQYGVKQGLDIVRANAVRPQNVVFYNVTGAEYLVSFYEKLEPAEVQKYGLRRTPYLFPPFNSDLMLLYAQQAALPSAYITLPVYPGPSGGTIVRVFAPGSEEAAAFVYFNKAASAP